MTHDEACAQLREIARAYAESEITRLEWFDQADAVLETQMPSAPGRMRELHDASHDLAPATRTSTRPGRRPPGASALRAAGLAPATGQAGQ